MTDKIKSIFEWYKQFNKTDLVLKSQTQEFQVEINNNSLPHLLGLQYMAKQKLKGYQLYNVARKLSDDEIFKNISKNNPSMLHSVKERVTYFRQFMENIESATLYEQSNENSKLKSQYLLVQTDDGKFLHLGIGKEENKEFLETFLVRKDGHYFESSSIREEIQQVLKLDQDNYPVPFSFDAEKNRVLEEERRRKIEQALYKDSDLDGLVDSLELAMGTNPYAVDTDGDGKSDVSEYASPDSPIIPDKKQELRDMISQSQKEAQSPDNYTTDKIVSKEREL